MESQAYVYFMVNQHNNVLYIGVTSHLLRRVAEHKAKINNGFTEKYNCDKLVYYEVSDSISDAICREKQLKNWKREWKDSLINQANPSWKDLSVKIGVTKDLVDDVKSQWNEIAGQARNDA